MVPEGCQLTAPASSSTRRRRPATSGEQGWRPGALEGAARSRIGIAQGSVQRDQRRTLRPFGS